MSKDQAVRLQALLANLEGGRISLTDAAAQIRSMKFPTPPPKTIAQRIEDASDNDVPPLPEPGSFREVSAAYVHGRITLRQYEVLADAAADAMKEAPIH